MADAAKMGRQRALSEHYQEYKRARAEFQDASAADVIRVFETGLRGGSDGVLAR
jgi:hypothetical protein